MKFGEPGTSMYIIASGTLEVQVSADTWIDLNERDIVGEIAVLDPGPRSATVRVLEDARLLKLERDLLYELMLDYPDVIYSIIRVLTSRLRRAADLLNACLYRAREYPKNPPIPGVT